MNAKERKSQEMPLIAICVALLFNLAVVAPVLAVDLNAPAEKTVTIGSEIARGYTAVLHSTDRIYDPLEVQEAVSNRLATERERNTDTDAFYLGAYYEAWREIKNLVAIDSEPRFRGLQSDRVLEESDQAAAVFFLDFRKKQRQLHIDDASFYQAILPAMPSVNTSFNPSFEDTETAFKEWDAKVGLTN
jgi:hypothetical protein